MAGLVMPLHYWNDFDSAHDALRAIVKARELAHRFECRDPRTVARDTDTADRFLLNELARVPGVIGVSAVNVYDEHPEATICVFRRAFAVECDNGYCYLLQRTD
jgi:hypothetical protein